MLTAGSGAPCNAIWAADVPACTGAVDQHGADAVIVAEGLEPAQYAAAMAGIGRPVIAAQDETAAAAQAQDAGAADVLDRADLSPALLTRAVRYAVDRARVKQELNFVRRRHDLISGISSEGFWYWDVASSRAELSPQWKSLLGYEGDQTGDSPEEWLGRIHPDEVRGHIEGKTPLFQSEHRLRDKQDAYRVMQVRGQSHRDDSGRALLFSRTCADVTEAKLAEAQLRQGAFYDSLTGLPNRAVFSDRLGRSIERARRRGDYLFAVLFLDLDRFKVVNDGLGHGIGDQLLVGVARRLEQCLRTSDTVARLGGDEFALLLEDIRDIYGQGHYMSRPLAAGTARELIAANPEW